MSARVTTTLLLALAWAWAAPMAADAQTTAPAAQAAQAPAAADDPSKLWIVAGGTAMTLRGDCQEDCPAHGTGSYLHTYSVQGIGGFRVNPHMDAGIEVSWVPFTTKAGDETRATFLLATSQFKPWATRGLFLNAGMGMAFIRNFGFTDNGSVDPITSKALGLTYGIGWTFNHTGRVGFQVFGAQHMAAMGDFESAGVVIENVVANFWSIGGAIVIR